MTDRWSLDALIARLELHPDFREVYVEGESDMGLYGWFLKEVGASDVLVYPITAVETTYQKEIGFDEEKMDRDSRRTEVILLSSVLQAKLPTAWRRITCIADADTQYILPQEYVSQFLLFTDHTSIEMYGFRADFITKMIRIASPKLTLTGEEILENLTPLLQALFSIRVTNHSLKWGLKWISPEKQCKHKDERIEFNEISFIQKYLDTKAKRKAEQEFKTALITLRQACHQNPKKQIRGHDFVEFLLWFLRLKSKRAYQAQTTDTVLHTLFAQLRREDLLTEPLFLALLEKYQST